MPCPAALAVPKNRTEAPALQEAVVDRRVNQYVVQALLLVLTLLTTTLIGMRYMDEFKLGQAPLTSRTDIMPYEWAWANAGKFAQGLPFSLTLIAILLAHEFGHYAACRYYGLTVTLPYLFPAPTLSGTFGAVIRIKSRIKSRAALMVVGASGPTAGFCIALVTTCYGLIHSNSLGGAAVPAMIRIEAPGLITVLREILIWSHVEIPPMQHLLPHPVLVASWIGILITSINLIPAGQLDGGHILYALSPRAHRISHHLMIGALLYLGTTEWIGWLFWAFLLLMPSMKHPRVMDKSPMGFGVFMLAPISLVIFAVTVATQPSSGMSLIQVIRLIH